MPIQRGIIYQSLSSELSSLFRALFGELGDAGTVSTFQETMAKYLGASHCLAFPMARTALYAALRARALPRGSKVIVPPLTVAPMVQVVAELGLEPVFVDIELDTLCFDPGKLAAAIDGETKAVLFTYLYGITPDVEELMRIARGAGLFTIEDFSHNMNASFGGRKLGTLGDVSVYSSSYTKTFDLYGGGLCFTDDAELHGRLLEEQGALPPPSRGSLARTILRNVFFNVLLSRPVFSVATFPAFFVMSRLAEGLFHRLTGPQPVEDLENGIPERWLASFSSLQAGTGLESLERLDALDARRIGNREAIVERVDNPAIRFPTELPKARNVHWQGIAFCERVDRIQRHLSRRWIDVGTTNLRLCSQEPAFGRWRAETPNAAHLKRNSFFVPIFPGLSRRDLDRIVRALNSYAP